MPEIHPDEVDVVLREAFLLGLGRFGGFGLSSVEPLLVERLGYVLFEQLLRRLNDLFDVLVRVKRDEPELMGTAPPIEDVRVPVGLVPVDQRVDGSLFSG